MSALDREHMLTPIDEKAMVGFSEDRTEAYISFFPPRNGGEELTEDQIKELIAENDIVYGLDENALKRVYRGSRDYNYRYVIATGTQPQNGKDGEIEYLFDAGRKTLSPKMNADGSVDYRNLNLIEMTEEGAPIIRAIAPVPGEDGMNVHGKPIPAREGKPTPRFPKGKNTRVSEDGTELIAEVTGQIVFSRGVVSVSEILTIPGDVDNSTGNIDFNGSITINGNILQGFRVLAHGNIEVKGTIEGAEVECSGNLIADKGILGMSKAQVKVAGSLYARMIQDAAVEVGGDIASDGIMHCYVKCGGRIELKGKKGVLVGGSVACKKEVDVNIIGSPLGTSTEVKVGLDANVYERYKVLMEEMHKLKKQYEALSKDLLVMSKNENISSLPEFRKKSYIKTLYDAKHIQESMKEKQAEAASLKAELDKFKYSGKIVVQSIVHPGVSVQIGNAVLSIRDQLPRCRFRNEDGRVKVNYNF